MAGLLCRNIIRTVLFDYNTGLSPSDRERKGNNSRPFLSLKNHASGLQTSHSISANIMDLPLEIIAHIGNLADLKTTLSLRTTCKTCLTVTSDKRIILHNVTSKNIHSTVKQLRHLHQISIEIRNTPDLSEQIIEELCQLDIRRLNITQIAIKDAKVLSLLIPLNLQCLEVFRADSKILNSFTNLTRLKIASEDVNDPPLDKMTKLEELHTFGRLFHVMKLNSTNLTKLVIENSQWYSGDSFIVDKSILHRLKTLTLRNSYSGSLREVLPHLTMLESLTSDWRIMQSDVSYMAQLTRLELSANCFGNGRFAEEVEDLSNYSKLTKLKVLSFKDIENKHTKSISFISKLPLVSATISNATRDDAQYIQYFKPQLLTELTISINNTSMFKNDLTRLTRLEALEVNSTTAVLVGGIDTLTLLTRLVLVKSQAKSLERLTRLKILHADLANSNTTVGWTALTALEQLAAKITTEMIEDVARLTNLNHLALDFGKPFKSNALSCLTKLTYLCLPKRDYPTLDWLAPLTNLEHLDLTSSMITMRDVVALTNLKQLTYLRVLDMKKYSNELRGLTKIF